MHVIAYKAAESQRHALHAQEVKKENGANGNGGLPTTASTEIDLHHEPAFGTEDTRVYPSERSSDDDERIEPAGRFVSGK